MEDSVEQAREVALRHLERRRRTRRELERRLRERSFSPGVIAETVDRLERVGLVDDLEYARVFLRERTSRRAVGNQIIRRQLAERGVPRALVDQALEELEESDPDASGVVSETERCQKALDKLLPRYADLEPQVRRRRLTAALSRRGFAFALISELLRETEQREQGL
jgi:regulatory protein